MIARALRKLVQVLGSAWLAVAALAFSGVWAIVGTAVPQASSTPAPTIAEWDGAHAALAVVVNALGLHRAWTAWPFVACLTILGISTVVCSWRRSRGALARSRALAGARTLGSGDLASVRDLAIPIAQGMPAPEALSVARSTLSRLGIRTKEREGTIAAVSPVWSVWGSALFHWSLVALMLVILAGNLQRSDGLMAVAVGQTKADEAASYGVLTTGPLHSWASIHRSLRVDALNPDMKLRGIDLGAVPTVSVLDENGAVLKKQLVYPNMMLHLGSLAINCPAVGLSANLSLVSPTGQVVGSTYEPIDFSQNATDGTVPVGYLTIGSASSDKVSARVGVTVPLDRVGSGFGEWLPNDPKANVTLYDATGLVVGEKTIRPGESVDLPGGGTIRLNGIGWYARLSVVDDWTTPYIYAAMVLALIGLSITLLTRQQLVAAAVVDGDRGAELAIRMRLWRNVPATRGEIESELRAALGGEPAHGGAKDDPRDAGDDADADADDSEENDS